MRVHLRPLLVVLVDVYGGVVLQIDVADFGLGFLGPLKYVFFVEDVRVAVQGTPAKIGLNRARVLAVVRTSRIYRRRCR